MQCSTFAIILLLTVSLSVAKNRHTFKTISKVDVVARSPEPHERSLVKRDCRQTVTIKLAGPSADESRCFPALGFNMPASVPGTVDGWWCDMSTEYAVSYTQTVVDVS